MRAIHLISGQEIDNIHVAPPAITESNYLLKGFTLIELSIVLVVIGLVVGGVLVARDLIASSQLRAQVTQFEKFNAAVNTFRGKFDCLPGDCANISKFLPNPNNYMCGFWGLVTCAGGNGDGLITDADGPNVYPGNIDGEPLAFWENLYLAKLTECCGSTADGTLIIGDKIPKDKINGYGISVMNLDNINGYYWGVINSTTSTGYYGGANPNIYSTLSGYPNGAIGVLTPAQARMFDAKIDDGSPVGGRAVTAWLYGGDARVHTYVYSSGQNCIASDSSYDLNFKTNACNLFIKLQ